MKKSVFSVLAGLVLLVTCVHAQGVKDGKILLSEDGSSYFKTTLLVQSWVRYQQYNPGTTIFGYPKESGADVGIRRFRMQTIGQLSDRIFVYAQFGENNFNNISDRKLGFFVHDAYGEYAVLKDKLSVGAGLSGWSGLSRFSSPSVGSILGVDAPLYLQSTNDVTDQFLRKLSVHAKGKIKRLDYRVALSQPMAIQKSAGYNPKPGPKATFSPRPPALETNLYAMYQFRDKESNLTPYTTGTYLGSKTVFNIGAGLVYQPRAMWYTGPQGDTLNHDMLQAAVDVYYDAPLNDRGGAVSFYGAFTFFNFGPEYLRNAGAMNPANGSNDPTILNGGGNAFPLAGTGNVLYLQAGYKLSAKPGKIGVMPYASIQYANYKALEKPVSFFDAGLNWYMKGHTSKLTTAFQSRPVFSSDGAYLSRKGAFIAQYQVFFG
ncbi:MAG: hypothetical protein ACKOZV_00890 [Bacteroidota bacterium]